MIVAKSHETSFVDACSNLSSIANIANTNWELGEKNQFLCASIFLLTVVYFFSHTYHAIEKKKRVWNEMKDRKISKSAFFASITF